MLDFYYTMSDSVFEEEEPPPLELEPPESLESSLDLGEEGVGVVQTGGGLWTPSGLFGGVSVESVVVDSGELGGVSLVSLG